ncbi:MAG: LON peptidase substrate-binding domain-containing protein [Paracoccaceae bacterium]
MNDKAKHLFEIDHKSLPTSVPLFPLDNVLLLPFGNLPLNMFEERYVKMAMDSLKSHRMIGMIQPRTSSDDLFQMGCIGKITSYTETKDFRIMLNLEGICRFILKDKILTEAGYYVAEVEFTDYLDDLNGFEPKIDRNDLIQKYSNFFKMKNLDIDLEALTETSNIQLLSTLPMIAPFDKMDKQAILESSNLHDRINTINSILDINTFEIGNVSKH